MLKQRHKWSKQVDRTWYRFICNYGDFKTIKNRFENSSSKKVGSSTVSPFAQSTPPTPLSQELLVMVRVIYHLCICVFMFIPLVWFHFHLHFSFLFNLPFHLSFLMCFHFEHTCFICYVHLYRSFSCFILNFVLIIISTGNSSVENPGGWNPPNKKEL